jgi:hypothetical protein
MIREKDLKKERKRESQAERRARDFQVLAERSRVSKRKASKNEGATSSFCTVERGHGEQKLARREHFGHDLGGGRTGKFAG